jgi:hypothetical protein
MKKMGQADQIGYILVWEKLKRSFSYKMLKNSVPGRLMCMWDDVNNKRDLRKICSGDEMST